MPELVPELILQIIEHLDNDSLRAASLASSFFRNPCQQALFSELVLLDPSGRLCGRLLAVLQQSPRILSYIKALTIRNGPRWETRCLSERLRDVIPLIPIDKLERFTLETIYGVWKEASFDLRRAVTAPSRGTSLVSLHLQGMPLHVVAPRSARLKQLTLADMWDDDIYRLDGDEDVLSDDSGDPYPSAWPRPEASPIFQLDSLRIDYDVDQIKFVTNPKKGIPIHGLKELRISGDNEGSFTLPDARPLLDASAPSLEVLEFRVDLLRYQDYLPIENISKMVSLRKLTFRCNLPLAGLASDPNYPRVSAYHWLPRLLERFAPPNLETITLHTRYFQPVDMREDASLWPVVDDALSDKGRYPNLRRVAILNMRYREPSDSEESAYLIFQELFPKLYHAGIFAFGDGWPGMEDLS